MSDNPGKTENQNCLQFRGGTSTYLAEELFKILLGKYIAGKLLTQLGLCHHTLNNSRIVELPLVRYYHGESEATRLQPWCDKEILATGSSTVAEHGLSCDVQPYARLVVTVQYKS